MKPSLQIKEIEPGVYRIWHQSSKGMTGRVQYPYTPVVETLLQSLVRSARFTIVDKMSLAHPIDQLIVCADQPPQEGEWAGFLAQLSLGSFLVFEYPRLQMNAPQNIKTIMGRTVWHLFCCFEDGEFGLVEYPSQAEMEEIWSEHVLCSEVKVFDHSSGPVKWIELWLTKTPPEAQLQAFCDALSPLCRLAPQRSLAAEVTKGPPPGGPFYIGLRV